MLKSQSAPTKALLSAGLFSLFLVTTATQKVMAKTSAPIEPLTTISRVPSLKQVPLQDMNTQSFSESSDSDLNAQQELEEQKVSWGFLRRRRRRRFGIWRRLFG